jgi:hypothetical protein
MLGSWSAQMSNTAEWKPMKFRVESVHFEAMDKAMQGTGMLEGKLAPLLTMTHGIVIMPDQNPEIFYVVTDEMVKKIQQDMNATRFNNKTERKNFIFTSKIGISPAMSLTEEGAKEVFKFKVAKENAA